MGDKIDVTKGTIQETLLLPLWGRAYEARKKTPRLIDEQAVEIIGKLDYDFSTIAATQEMSQHGWVARSIHTDKMVKQFIQKHPKATIVNIGCGMDTTFNRIDNGTISFFELDLPDVIKLRKKFIQDSDRHKCIASSFLETKWFNKIDDSEGLLFLAGGVLYYFSEEQIREFFLKAADNFKECDFYFDSLSPFGLKIATKKVLESGGMGATSFTGWGLKPVNSLEKWDNRISIEGAIPMYRGMKKGLPFSTKIMLTMPDVMGVCKMVHVKIKNKHH